MRTALLATALLVATVAASAQTPTFDVASIKPTPPDTTMTRFGFPGPGGRWSASNVTLLQIMQRSGSFEPYSRPGLIVGGPAWVRTDKFDINAKAEGEPTRAQVLLMVQQMLVDRFKLRTHVERRPVDSYALVKARADGRLGPGLRPNPVDCRAVIAAGGGVPIMAPPSGARPPCSSRSPLSANGLVQFSETWLLRQLVVAFQGWMDRIVIDHTGLEGFYDIDLQFDFATTRSPDGNGAGPSIFTGLQEQLGLKLEPRREDMDVLVIDSVERPTPD
jgi:uncharacterized protein (TIGR03435 family)